MENQVQLQTERQKFQPRLPKALQNVSHLRAVASKTGVEENIDLKDLFSETLNLPKLLFERGGRPVRDPLTIGVVFSGGQAAGGHNVIAGIFDAMKQFHPDSVLIGFLNGPAGIIENNWMTIDEEQLSHFRNQGGFDMIGAGRAKIETPDQFAKAAMTARDHKLDGLVIIGGDDSNTNAALLAEYYLSHQIATCVVGVPKTIDGDLKNQEIEISFGFDTATKIFSETIGSLLRDCLSAKKYYFFIKLMGRSASHIALECALQTHPNLTLIGEEVEKENYTLKDLTHQICDLICKRAEKGKHYGVILIPEGIIEFIPEFKQLINELNQLKLETGFSEKVNYVSKQLSPSAKACFCSIPKNLQAQLLLERDPHGNVQVSKIETERLFIQSVEEELNKRKSIAKFKAQPLFCGYEGRSCYPSNFDANYCYTLGYVASLLIKSKSTGYMSCVRNLNRPVEEWNVAGIPLTSMIHMEKRKGVVKPVIKKALVDLKGAAFCIFQEERDFWMVNDDYRYPGPIQYFGPSEIKDQVTLTLRYEQGDYSKTHSKAN